MFGSDIFETLFLASAFLFQIILVIHFGMRKWYFDLAMQYGRIVYVLAIPAAILSMYLLLRGLSWTFWVSGCIYLLWAINGYWIEYVRLIQWRNPIRWSIFGPYMTLYLATVMFYWWPLALIWKPWWYFYAVLFIISTYLNITSHERKNQLKPKEAMR